MRLPLRHVENRYNDIERIGANKDCRRRLEHPLKDNPVVDVVQVIAVNEYLNELVGHNESQDQPDYGQYHCFEKVPDQEEHPGVPRRRGCSHLCRNLPDLGIDGIEKPRKVSHDPVNEQLFQPVGEKVRRSPPLK